MDFVAVPAAPNACDAILGLEPGRHCTVEVLFRPTSLGSKIGSLSVSVGGRTVSASLSGTGIAPAQLAISPAQQVLSGVPGTVGPPVVFTIANIGEVATGAVAVALAGPNRSDFKFISNGCLPPLAMGASCQVSVALSTVAAGAKSAQLIASSPWGGNAVAFLTAAMLTEGMPTITPSSMDFMTVAVNTTSAARTFEIKNSGPAPTEPLFVSVSSDEFLISVNTCSGLSVPAGGSCSVSVVFKPTSVGQKSGVLTVVSGTEMATATIAGTGG